MSEQEEWAEEPVVPPKKGGLPGWLLFCGGGCLIAVILGTIGAFFMVKEVQKMIDPEVQWESLEESFELDERPPELTMMFGSHIGIDLWMIQDNRGYIAAIYDFGEAEAQDRDELFSEDFQGGGVPGLSKIEDPEVGEVAVQGRTLPIVRFINQGGFNPGGQEEVAGQGGACFVDLTAEGVPGFQMLFLMRMDGKKDPISDEAVQQFLEPFVIGPKRQLYSAPGDAGGGAQGSDEGDGAEGDGQ